jgi:hypothetical protein
MAGCVETRPFARPGSDRRERRRPGRDRIGLYELKKPAVAAADRPPDRSTRAASSPRGARTHDYNIGGLLMGHPPLSPEGTPRKFLHLLSMSSTGCPGLTLASVKPRGVR